jgi:folate-binding protein YgfZ
MIQTVLHESLARAGAVAREDRGILLPHDFGDAAREYRALTTDVAVLDYGFRAVVLATGPDRIDFLQGMLTNDVAGLALGQGCGSLQLTIQGRVLADVRVGADADYALLDVDRRVQPGFVAALQRLIIADDVELVDPVPSLAVLGVEGPGVERIVPAAGGLSPFGWTMTRVGECLVRCMRASDLRAEGVILYVPADSAAQVWEALVAAGAVPCGMAALEARRIERGVPRIGLDMDEHCLSLEVPVDDLVSFRKGCYLGQEVVARGTARGHVNRRLVGLRCDTAAVRGTALQRDGKDVGGLTSVGTSPITGDVVALGFVRREHWDPGTVLTLASGGQAVVAGWPLA